MAKIYSKNKQYNGISASVNFINGVGESNLPHLVSWFQENGYTIVENKRAPSIYDSMAYKEMTELARKRGFNGIGLKKEKLIIALILWDKEHIAEIETEE
ncbi:MAG TPA: hypothetical protein DD730_00565 [Desulfosporosinus sp.]|nr:hypothetical protein [Desulfosporosinus sp.]